MEELTGRPASVWARDQRRPRLTREAIVEAAVEIADTEGIEAITIRRVAAELGVRPMSLYTHIDRKEDIYDLMADHIVGTILVDDDELTGDWRTSITRIVERERTGMIEHPWVGDLLGRRTTVGPNTLRHIEQSLAAVEGLGADVETSAMIVHVVDQYMLGYVMMELAGRHRTSDVVKEYVRDAAASGDYPRLSKILVAELPKSTSFEQGLSWLLDGIEADIKRNRTAL